MTNSRALIGFVVDRSGSMASCNKEMEVGIKEFLADQGNQEYEADASLAQFDTTYELVYPPTPIQDVPEYRLHPRYGTALYDAVGRFVVDLGAELKKRKESQRPGKVLIVIVTDGYENSSQEYRGEQGRQAIQKLIKHQKEKYSWDFVFLGANMDAQAIGEGLGIARGSSLTFDSTYLQPGVYTSSLSNYATAYNSSVVGAAAPSFTEEDRKLAMNEEPVTSGGNTKSK